MTGGGHDRVLLVEDEALVAMVAEELLACLGFEVLTARNAEEALALMASNPTPAAALVDVGLPGVRGDQLAEQLRGQAPEMPVVMATGYDNSDLRQRFRQDSRVGFLAKPYSEGDLSRALSSVGVAAKPG